MKSCKLPLATCKGKNMLYKHTKMIRKCRYRDKYALVGDDGSKIWGKNRYYYCLWEHVLNFNFLTFMTLASVLICDLYFMT